MPFYEYQCQACGAQVEVMQKITDAPLKKCPECGKNRLTKLVSAPVFRLKGGGWYETDFKSDKESKRNLAVEKEPESAPASDSKAAESKTEAKSAEAKPAGESKAAESKPVAAKGSRSAASSSASRARPRPAAAAKAKSPAKSKAKPA